MSFSKEKERHIVIGVLIRRTFIEEKAALFDLSVIFPVCEKIARFAPTVYSNK